MFTFLLLPPIAPAAHAIDAIARARHDLQLGFTVSGRVAEVPVRPGDHVEPEALLIRLDDRAATTLVDLNRIKADSDLARRIAEAELALAQGRETRVRDAHSRDAADAFELEEAVMETTRRRLQLELAQRQQAEAAHQLRLAEISAEQYHLRAPGRGVIEDVLVAPGELVDELQGVVRLIVTDPLVIDVSVPVADTLTLKPGDAATVSFDIAPDAAPVTGRIVQLSSLADAGSGTRRVRVEAPNPAGFPAGCLVDVQFAIRPAATPRPAPRSHLGTLPLIFAALLPALGLAHPRRPSC